MNFYQRNHAVFGSGTPEYTPADRLDALDRVAERARAFRDAGDDPNLEETWQELVSALHELDKIERYQGKRIALVNTVRPHGRAS